MRSELNNQDSLLWEAFAKIAAKANLSQQQEIEKNLFLSELEQLYCEFHQQLNYKNQLVIQDYYQKVLSRVHHQFKKS